MISRVILLLSLCIIAACDHCTGVANNSPLFTGEPILLRSTKNGKLYTVGNRSETLYPMFVLHTWGTPYEMGYAHGILLKTEATNLIRNMYKHIESTLDQYLNFLPQKLKEIIERLGLDIALDLTYEMTRFYTPKYWEEEMHGLADASGVPFNDILRLHMLPELIKAGCSMFTAYGEATPNGNLLQLRALDWDTQANLQIYSVVQVRHPNQDGSFGHAFATLGWAGWLSGLTGMSSNGMAISEKYGDRKSVV